MDGGLPRELGAEAVATLTALTDIPSRFFASQNRMTSFTWPNRLGGSSCSAAFQKPSALRK